jgi:hypothetical protein
MKCPNNKCKFEISPHLVNCVVCGTHVGFPNVRCADDPSERTALRVRFNAALVDAKARKCEPKVREFFAAVEKSQVVINRPLAFISQLAASDNEVYSTYALSVGAEARLPRDNKWDRSRESVETALFPNYHQYIRFGALTLNGRGPNGYGEVSMVLREAAIKTRATVFEENLFVFFEHHALVTGRPVPKGYRARWDERGRLAVAKLASKITPATPKEAFPDLLLQSSQATDSDYIEAHVYGPLHRRSIAQITLRQPHRKADKILLKVVQKDLGEVGARVTVLP